MSVELTRRGTRGQAMPGGPLKALFLALARLAHRLGLTKQMDGYPVVLLTTRGARSGQLRSVPVMAFPEAADSWLVVASAAGAASHPAWAVNMARNPDDVWIDVEARHLRVAPASLGGEDREAAWKSIIERSSRFGGYQSKTDREIPVIRLRAVPE
jgi:deazaflavin-dependent oxidoreductase (nitroreductase family)